MRRHHAVLLAAAMLPALLLAGCSGGEKEKDTVRIGTKNFTEQFILGEMMKAVIEAKTGLSVEMNSNLGGTMICHGALVEGELDLYAEYTGTGLTAVLKKEVVSDPEKAFEIVSSEYQKRFGCVWLKPFGFNNTYTITVRKKDAEEKGWEKVSDLVPAAKDLRAGFTAEFMERPDGYPKLKKAYGLEFGKVSDLDPGLMYEAAAHGEVDVICGFATDGRIAALDLMALQDDRGVFPPYFAAPVVGKEAIEKHPALKTALELLAGKIDDRKMQELNLEVDQNKKDPAAVARAFLNAEKIIE